MPNFRNVKIRFECGQADRASEDLGPFEFAQITYEALRVGETGDVFLAHADENHWWVTPDGQKWSDVVIFGVNDPIVDPAAPSDWQQTVVAAGAAAIDLHTAQTQLEDETSETSQLWHLLLSLQHWATARNVDFDAALAEMKREHRAGIV